jgi:rhodanese-related sulfurtransferase
VAVAAFIATGRIEQRVNPAGPARAFRSRLHRLAAAGFVAAAVVAALVPDSRTRLLAKAADEQYRRAHPVERMTADELAFRVVDQDPKLVIMDVRPAADFAKACLPGAVNLAPADLFGRAVPPTLAQPHRRKVFVGATEREADEAATLARLLGFENVAVLEGGCNGFRSTVLAAAASTAGAPGTGDTQAFRAEAGRQIAALIKASAGAGAVVRKPKKIAGGCGV